MKNTGVRFICTEYINKKSTGIVHHKEDVCHMEKIHEELKQLTNALHIIKQDRKMLKEAEKRNNLYSKRLLQYYEYAHTKNETKESHIDFIARQLTNRLDLDPKESKRARRVIERCFDAFELCTILRTDIIFDRKSIPEPDKGP